MNFKELFEGAQPKLPGQEGSLIMTPQQFVVNTTGETSDNTVDESSDISGLLSANHLNKSFIITAKTKEGIEKKYRVHAQSKLIAIEKFSKHHNMANILSVEEEKINEATKLPASTRELKGKELEDYLDRIKNKEKNKTDKYKLPYIHRSSVLGYYNEEGKKYNIDAIKDALKERPKKLLKQNET